MVFFEVPNSIVQGTEEVHVAHPLLLAQAVGRSQQIPMCSPMRGIIARDSVLPMVVSEDQAHHEGHHARAVGLEVDRDEKPMLEPNNEIFARHSRGLSVRQTISKQRDDCDQTQRRHLRGLPCRAFRQNGLSAGPKIKDES